MTAHRPAASKPGKSFTPFYSAAEELAMQQEADGWDNEGGCHRVHRRPRPEAAAATANPASFSPTDQIAKDISL